MSNPTAAPVMGKTDFDRESQCSKLDRLLTTWEGLGPLERTALLTIGMRLKAGQKQYGMIGSYDKKDWSVEEEEEHLDSCVYAALRLGASVQKAFERSVKNAEDEVTASLAVKDTGQVDARDQRDQVVRCGGQYGPDEVQTCSRYGAPHGTGSDYSDAYDDNSVAFG